MGIKQIERAITQLPAKDLAVLMSWLEHYHAQVLDKRIEEDLETGRLDALLREVDEEYEAGLTQPLSGISLLPASGDIIGGFQAEFRNWQTRALSWAMCPSNTPRGLVLCS